MIREWKPGHQNHHRGTPGVFLSGPGGRRRILVNFNFRLKCCRDDDFRDIMVEKMMNFRCPGDGRHRIRIITGTPQECF